MPAYGEAINLLLTEYLRKPAIYFYHKGGLRSIA